MNRLFRFSLAYFWLALSAGCTTGGGVISEIRLGRNHNNALQIAVDITTTKPVKTKIRYWPDSLTETQAFESPESALSTNHHIVLLNILPATKYAYKVLADGNEATKSESFSSPPLPMWLQEQFKATKDTLGLLPQSFKEGFMLLNKRETPGVDYIVDYKGRIRWYHEVDGTGFKVTHFTKDQTVLSILGKNDEPTSYGSEILEINLQGDTIAYLKKGMGDLRYSIHHEILKNDSGQYITLFVDSRVMDLRSIGGGAKDTVNGDGILILDRNGRKIRQWSVFDVVDPLKDPNLLKTKKDWMHANSLNFDSSGDYIMSFYNNGQIWGIDPKTGQVSWKFGKGGDIQMPAEVSFSQSHAVHINREGSLMFFNNGVEHRLSEVYAVKLDKTHKTSTLDMHIKLPPDIYNDRMGSAYLITDSTVLCCSSKRKITVLVDRKGLLLWDMETAIPPYRVEFITKTQASPWLQSF